MGLDVTNIFPTAQSGADEFFTSEAEEAQRPRTVIKTADQTVSSETLVNDTELLMSLSANQTYEFELVIEATCNDGDRDMDYTFTVPAGAIGRFWGIVNGGSILTTFTPLVFGTEVYGALDSTKRWFVARGWVKTGNTTGNLQFQFAEFDAGSGTGTTVYADSYLKVTKQ